jgi:hypothetical protein
LLEIRWAGRKLKDTDPYSGETVAEIVMANESDLGGMVTSTINVLILVPVFFAMMKDRALRRGTLFAESSS